jgi:ABC-type multidrug transport system ATPase subunit
MNELAIGTKDLAKTYASIRAISGVNLTVPRGSIYGFLAATSPRLASLGMC